MAEFCLDCWNRMNETNDRPEKWILSEEAEFCEGCGQWKPVIIRERRIPLPRFISKLREKRKPR